MELPLGAKERREHRTNHAACRQNDQARRKLRMRQKLRVRLDIQLPGLIGKVLRSLRRRHDKVHAPISNQARVINDRHQANAER